jgi:outer membrane protein
MNRIHLIALLGVALLTVPLVRQGHAGDSTMKIGVIDLERTLYETAAGKRADAKFEKTRKKKQDQLDKEQKALQKYAAELDKQATVLKPDVLEQKKADLQQKFVDLQDTYKKLETELASERNDLIQDLLKQASPMIEDIAKAEGITVIVDASAVVWADKSVDLTDKLNDKMK